MNLFLFFGPDQFSLKKKIQTWKKEFVKKHGENNLFELDGRKISKGELIQTLQSIPFLAEKKLVIITNIFKNKKLLPDATDIFKKIPSSTLCILSESESTDKRTKLYKFLKKEAKIEEFKEPSEQEIINKIQKSAKINSQNSRYLAHRLGFKLGTISNELKKLKLYSLENEITKETIDLLTNENIQNTIFKLTDQISSKNASLAIQTLKQLLISGEEPMMILHMIIRQFRLLITTKSLVQKGLNPSEIQKELKQHPFVVKKSIEQSKKFELNQLQKTFKSLLDLEIAIKTGIIRTSTDDKSELELEIEKILLTI